MEKKREKYKIKKNVIRRKVNSAKIQLVDAELPAWQVRLR